MVFLDHLGIASADMQLSGDYGADAGLPRRPWFKHVLQAPGLYLGYAAQAFPGVTQAVEEADWATADAQLSAATAAVKRAAEFLGGVAQGAIGAMFWPAAVA
jgi:hypothetical protein